MSSHDAIYYEKRAEAQLALAQKAKTGKAVQAHYDLASAYLDLVYGQDISADEPAVSQAA